MRIDAVCHNRFPENFAVHRILQAFFNCCLHHTRCARSSLQAATGKACHLQVETFAEARFGQDGGDGHRLQAALRGSFTPQLRFGISLADGRRQSTPQSADATLTAVEGRRPREAAVHLAWLPVEGHTVKLDTRHADELRWFDARERSGKKRLYQSETPLVRDHHLLAWEADWGGGRESLLRVYENRLDTRNTRSNGVAPLRPNVLGDQVLEGQFAQPLPGGQQLTAGFEHRTEWLDNAALPGGHAQARHTGLYVQDEARIGRSLLLTGGLRHDNTQGYASQWSPRVYAVWTLAPEWVLKGGAGSGFKAPNLKQVNPAYREDEGPSTYLGQAGLRPELNRSLEAGLAWDRANTGASLMLFQNRIHDLITPVLLILGTLVVKGGSAISWEFLFTAPTDGMRSGGVFPALLGTVWLVTVALLLSVPIGVFAAIYLSEYATDGPFIRFLRLSIVNLAGVPSIVFGPSPIEMGGVDEYVEVEEFLDVVRTHVLSAYDYLSRP